MSDSDNGGCIAAVLWIVTVAISIGSGVLAWRWVDPDSFIKGVLFIIVWGILSTVGYYIGMGIVALLGGMK
jgi:hypothetical protein